MQPCRSYLYVPGSKPRMIEKALATEADAIVIDLEDAVSPSLKNAARRNATSVLQSAAAKPILIRVNPTGTEAAELDAACLQSARPAGIRLAKSRSAEDVQAMALMLDRYDCRAELYPLLESPKAVLEADSIARAHPRVSGIALGEADLASVLGSGADLLLDHLRVRCVLASHAADLAPPVQAVYGRIGDEDGLRLSTERGKALGFFGRSAIHPSQIRIINETYSLSVEELQHAQELTTSLERAESGGDATLLLEDGTFVDRAVADGATRKVELGALLQAAPESSSDKTERA